MAVTVQGKEKSDTRRMKQWQCKEKAVICPSVDKRKREKMAYVSIKTQDLKGKTLCHKITGLKLNP